MVLVAVDDMPFDKLAELADPVNDYSGTSSAVSSITVTSDLKARQSHLEEKIDRLMDTMTAMQMGTPVALDWLRVAHVCIPIPG